MTFVTCHKVTTNSNIGVGKEFFRAILRGWIRTFPGEVMAMKVRVLFSCFVVMSMMWLVGCGGHYTCGTTFGNATCSSAGSGGIGQGGGGNTIQNPVAFDYFFETFTLNAAFLNTSNNFNLIPNFTSPSVPLTGAGVGGMVVVQKKWLYIGLGPHVAGFSINVGTGALTALTGSPFASPSTEAYAITTDPAGQFLFLSAANDAQVVVFAINQTTGALTTVGTFATAGFAGGITTDGLGKYLYVTQANLGTEVTAFAIATSGALTPVVGSPFAISIAQLRSEPTGTFLFGVTGNGANNGFTSDNHIYVFSIDQTRGVITPATDSPFATAFTPANLEVHPGGKFVFTFDQTVTGANSGTEVYQFNAAGALTPVTGSPFTGVTGSDGRFDQSGAFLFTHPGTALSVASVNITTGALSTVASVTGVGNPSGFAVTDTH
jgi:6-phosphogluconolactonase (cycloisomerase 2 family)